LAEFSENDRFDSVHISDTFLLTLANPYTP
jgi:hypothetical protein